jgi:hypothetical protein
MSGQAGDCRRPQVYLDVATLNGITIALLVAPDDMVRRSLEFVIQAEGIIVDSHAFLASAIESPFLKKADCAVVDEDAVRAQKNDLDSLRKLPWPIILLTERPEQHRTISGTVPVHVLAKPLLGAILIETLRRLWAGQQE